MLFFFVVVFLWWSFCGTMQVCCGCGVVILFLWWCLCGGDFFVVVFLWWCFLWCFFFCGTFFVVWFLWSLVFFVVMMCGAFVLGGVFFFFVVVIFFMGLKKKAWLYTQWEDFFCLTVLSPFNCLQCVDANRQGMPGQVVVPCQKKSCCLLCHPFQFFFCGK